MERKCKQLERLATVSAVAVALLIVCSWASRASAAAQIINYAVDDTVAYNWVDISGTGTNLGLGGCDDCVASFTLPFTFEFYGTPYTSAWVSSNGGMSFTDSSITYSNTCLPSTNQTTFIAPFWDDLDTYLGAGVYWQVQGSAPNRQVIVQWHNVNRLYQHPSATFQVILSEGSNHILFQYQDVDFVDDEFDNGAQATVGVQRDDTEATQYSCLEPALADGMAILFTPATFDLTLSKSLAGVCKGKTASLTGTVENASGSAQTYTLGSQILTGTGTVFTPSTLTVPDGGTGNFTATVRTSDSVLAALSASQGGLQDREKIEVSVEPGVWLAETPSPEGFVYGAVAAHGNSLYQIGGVDATWNMTTAVYRYDTVSKTWAARTDLPSPVLETNAATIGDKIYLPGGYNWDTGVLNTLHIYDPTSNNWSTGATLPVPLYNPSVVTDGQKLYVVGGYDDASGQSSDKLYIYDPALDSWTTGADMPAGTGGYYASAAYIGGKIYVAGGVVGPSSVDTLAMQVYTVASNTWSAGPALPDPGLTSYDGGWSASNGGVIDNRYFVVFGGDKNYWECSRKAVVFDTQKGKWEDAGSLNACLIDSKGAAVDGMFYRIGGEKDYGPFDDSTEYYSQCQGFPWPMFMPAIEQGGTP